MDETVVKQVTDAIEKSVPEIVSTVVDAKLNEAMSKSAKELDEIKAELKKYSLEQKQANPEVKEAFVKTAMVNIFRDVVNQNITTEKGFQTVVEATLKTMTEGTATAGAELVFDQFEADVLRVINSYDIVNDVRILPLAKGDKVSIPKATNGVTTYFTSE
jgi:HK97 family phage major capsid protein